MAAIQSALAFLAASPAPAPEDGQSGGTFQARVDPWLIACFGEEIARDREERNHRFLEEALELVQAKGCTAHEAHQLVDYVYGRPAGIDIQEVGGVMVTLAALCLANHLDMHEAGEIELARIWTKVEKIRAKQAAKPKHSPLPEHVLVPAPASTTDERERVGVPFYERTLDSFSDQIITTVHPGDNGLWYAVLDRGSDIYISTDFSTCGRSAAQAVALCAAKIRADQRGEGKFAPHGCMVADGYDFRWKLCKWWVEKERLVAAATALATPPETPADGGWLPIESTQEIECLAKFERFVAEKCVLLSKTKYRDGKHSETDLHIVSLASIGKKLDANGTCRKCVDAAIVALARVADILQSSKAAPPSASAPTTTTEG